MPNIKNLDLILKYKCKIVETIKFLNLRKWWKSNQMMNSVWIVNALLVITLIIIKRDAAVSSFVLLSSY